MTEEPYPAIEYWQSQKLIETYRRLSEELGDTMDDPPFDQDYPVEHFARMCAVEEEMRARGLDPEKVAREARS